MFNSFLVTLCLIFFQLSSFANICLPDTLPLSSFVSLSPALQDPSMHIPPGYNFQIMAEKDMPMSVGITFMADFDFTGFVPINGSSKNGYLSINHESVPGGVSMMDIAFNTTTKRWMRSNEKKVDFSGVVGTVANCSGTVTPWNTIITCEEHPYYSDINNDGYYDMGWAVELDPVTKTVINNQKLWALGNFAHENIVIHNNQRTAYQGADASIGYLFKFVANNPQDLSSGSLYVYKGSKNGSGQWLQINNTTKSDRNNTNAQCSALDATVFAGIEDVEINPINGWVYLAVKGESAVYRFQDSDPISGTTVPIFETFVGGSGVSYTLSTSSGNVVEPWGTGNDNLAFDKQGNLWVLQDGSRNYLWVVDATHTQANPKVKIFMRTPAGSEPTGITFSPDYNFLFMSIQHPGPNNSTTQNDVNNNSIKFDRDAAIVIARDLIWQVTPCQTSITQPNAILSDGEFKSQSFINSAAIINSPSTVNLYAKNQINLQPGFVVQNGAVFLGKIEGCE